MARIKFNKNEHARLLRGPEVTRMVLASAERIASSAGRGFDATTWVSPDPGRRTPPRVTGFVSAEDYAARRRNSRDQVLLRARGAGRV